MLVSMAVGAVFMLALLFVTRIPTASADAAAGAPSSGKSVSTIVTSSLYSTSQIGTIVVNDPVSGKTTVVAYEVYFPSGGTQGQIGLGLSAPQSFSY
jgi:hypothetical protein